MSSGRRGLATTSAGAEFGLVLAFVILRVFDLIQLGIAAPGSLSRSPAPTLDVGLIVGFTVWSALLCVVLVRRRQFTDPRLVWADVLVGAIVLIVTPAFTQSADRFSSWAAWGYAVTLSVVVGTGIGLRRWWQTLLAVGVLGGLYLVVTLPGASTSAETLTTITNSLAYLMFAVVIRFPAGYMRRLAADADTARSEAAALAQDAERARHRLLLHDHASVLSLLSRDNLDPTLVGVVRAQAADGASKVRRFLAEDPDPVSAFTQQLAAVVAEFPDLEPVLNVDQATAALTDELSVAVGDAVRTLLHNVRNHAAATEVVVYVATPPGIWEVQVSDNGCGFDPTVVVEGFGLSHQVRRRIKECGGQVEVASKPGEGTIVSLTGPRP